MTVVRESASLDELIPAEASVRRLAAGFSFTEGPVWNSAEQALYFSDIPGSTIWRINEAAGLTLFRKPSNMANGLALDHAGRLIACEHETSRVTRTERDGNIVVLADRYDGLELNAPNDVIVKSDGSVLFTDPTYGRSAFFGVERPESQPSRGVYSVGPDGSSLSLLTADLMQPNGLCFTADEGQLYIIDTERAHIRRFDVRADGSLADSVVFYSFPDTGEPGVPDGMKLDRHGNLYSTGPGGIWIISPQCELLGRIMVPEVAANLAWGGQRLDKLFITASTALYCIDIVAQGG